MPARVCGRSGLVSMKRGLRPRRYLAGELYAVTHGSTTPHRVDHRVKVALSGKYVFNPRGSTMMLAIPG